MSSGLTATPSRGSSFHPFGILRVGVGIVVRESVDDLVGYVVGHVAEEIPDRGDEAAAGLFLQLGLDMILVVAMEPFGGLCPLRRGVEIKSVGGVVPPLRPGRDVYGLKIAFEMPDPRALGRGPDELGADRRQGPGGPSRVCRRRILDAGVGVAEEAVMDLGLVALGHVLRGDAPGARRVRDRLKLGAHSPAVLKRVRLDENGRDDLPHPVELREARVGIERVELVVLPVGAAEHRPSTPCSTVWMIPPGQRYLSALGSNPSDGAGSLPKGGLHTPPECWFVSHSSEAVAWATSVRRRVKMPEWA